MTLPATNQAFHDRGTLQDLSLLLDRLENVDLDTTPVPFPADIDGVKLWLDDLAEYIGSTGLDLGAIVRQFPPSWEVKR